MDYSYHSLILVVGFAVAGLALSGVVAIGPHGSRGARIAFAMVSFAAFLGSALWLMTYLGLVDQRRTIETRLAELRAQALGAGSTLACLERSGEIVETACAQTLFAAPETLAAANFYTAMRLDVLAAAARYTGPRTAQFDEAVAALQRSLQQDTFGLTANTLVLREGCTAQRCDSLALFRDPARLRENIRQRTFEENAARYASGWRAPTASAAPAAAAPAAPAMAAPLPSPGIIAPTGGETRAPIPDKYTLPSSASIPPVSIMNAEPKLPANADAPPAAAPNAALPLPPKRPAPPAPAR